MFPFCICILYIYCLFDMVPSFSTQLSSNLFHSFYEYGSHGSHLHNGGGVDGFFIPYTASFIILYRNPDYKWISVRFYEMGDTIEKKYVHLIRTYSDRL